MLRVRVLGSAAGGGFPQWNCAAPASRRARAGDSAAPARTQTSLAVSADGERWVLLNASPDLRQQIGATPALHPNPASGMARHSPIAAVVLTGAEIDTIAGLLSLREGHAFALYAGAGTLAVLAANPVFSVLPPERVPRRTLPPAGTLMLEDVGRASLGVALEVFPVPGKPPLFDAGAGEETIGLALGAGAARLFFIPGCAAMPPDLAARLRNADCVMFDGTLWRDDELAEAVPGGRTGRLMGHMSLSGPAGTLAAFAPLGVRRRILIHLNTTNPVLLADSPERRTVAEAGWDVAEDGMEFTL